MKKCTRCKTELEEWRRGHYCRDCAATMQRERRARDPEKAREADRRRRATESPEQRARRHERARANTRARRVERYGDRRCEECGAAIPLEANGAQKLCSDECRLVRRDRKNREYHRTHHVPVRGTPESGRRISEAMRRRWETPAFRDRQCVACDAMFSPNGTSQRYCSTECQIWTRRGRLYGVSAAFLQDLFARQGGRCALCDTAHPFERLRVDHCHATGAVRGFLCTGCNTSLGWFEDSPARLRAAAEYVERGAP